MALRNLPAIEKTVTKEQISLYADVSGDRNPVHLDEVFAAQSYFGKIVAHGMLTLAFLSEMMTEAFGVAWLESGGMKIRFKKPAYIGDTVKTWGRVVKEEMNNNQWAVTCEIKLLKEVSNEELITGNATLVLLSRIGD